MSQSAATRGRDGAPDDESEVARGSAVATTPRSISRAISSITSSGSRRQLRQRSSERRCELVERCWRQDRSLVERLEEVAPRSRRCGGAARALAGHAASKLLEAPGIVERADEREVEPLVLEEVFRNALHVLDRHEVELAEELVRLLDLAFEHLAPQPVLDRPLRALEAEHEASLRVAARLLELLGRNGLGCDLPQLAEDRRDRLVDARDVDAGARVEGAGVRVRGVSRVHVVAEAAPLAHLGEEARRHAAAEHDGEELERVAIRVPDRVAADAEDEVRLLGGLRVEQDG